MVAKSSPVHICHKCHRRDYRADEHKLFCGVSGALITAPLAPGFVCPLDYFDHPPPAHERPPAELTIGGVSPDKITQAFRSVWHTIHRRPGTLPPDFDREAERRWLALLPLDVPRECGCKISPETAALAEKVGAARAWWAWALEQHPINLTSLRTYHDSLVRIHNAKNVELDKPQLASARAARIHGCEHLFTAEEIATDVAASGPIALHVVNRWSPGDVIAGTAALRDLLAAYPGEYALSVQSCLGEIYQNLPGITLDKPSSPEIVCDYVTSANPATSLIDHFRDRLSACIGRPIPAGEPKPWIVLSDEEQAAAPPVSGPYWIVGAGHKTDVETKVWPSEKWQAAITELGQRGISLVRVGANGSQSGGIRHVQPALQGFAADLVGKTTLRQLFAMIAHHNCQGVLSIITSLTHIAAAFGKKRVVIAGDREPQVCASYADASGSVWLSSFMPCAGCWRMKVTAPPTAAPSPNHTGLCLAPTSSGHASCMSRITVEQVVTAVCNVAEAKVADRIGVCSFYTPNIADWARPCTAILSDYCRRKGYAFIQPPEKIIAARSGAWQKPEILIGHLAAHDWLWWIDADCIIADPDFDLQSIAQFGDADLYIAKDHNHRVNNGVFALRNTPAAFDLLLRWQASCPPAKAQDQLSDQNQMGHCIAEMGDKLRTLYLPYHAINAYDHLWKPGDFIAHVSGRSQAERVRIIGHWRQHGCLPDGMTVPVGH